MSNRHLSYHEGELAVQAQAGVRRGGLEAESMYHATMGAGVARFLAAQQLAALSSMDGEGRLWASVRSGPPGFLRALDELTLAIGGYSHPDDPLLANLAHSAMAGVLVINLLSRQRVRINGMASHTADGKVQLKVQQVYGNCPQYIQAREVTGEREVKSGAAHAQHALDDRLRLWVEGADTFFLGTGHPESGLDASHRGGKPGFVRVENANSLLIPDYPGNNMFNSLGNLSVYPKAGLVFPDFESGATLQLSGSTKILWDDKRVGEFPGARRLISYEIERMVELPQAMRLKFEFRGYSPHLL